MKSFNTGGYCAGTKPNLTSGAPAASTTISAKTASPVAGCPKCGKLKKSGKPNCCAPGGAWFNKCGSTGDAKFDHTWAEGNDACKKKSPPSTTIPSSECSKCGYIKKSGQFSCCVRGGAWFKNCGNPGDSKFDHTWLQGLHACKKITSPLPTTPAATTAASACPKCGTLKSGK